MQQLSIVLDLYNLKGTFSFFKIGDGLIHNTWLVSSTSNKYILQEINIGIFKRPADIEYNCNLLSDHISAYGEKTFRIVTALPSINGATNIELNGKVYRLFPFIENSHTITKVENEVQAYEASKQFGMFAKKFSKIDSSTLKITLPDFHNLPLRHRQFLLSIKTGNEKRINDSRHLINHINDQYNIVTEYIKIISNPAFKLRVMHNDTKISNVLFNESGKGICVIDLDTVMPGYFISDVGDMMRTYLSVANEEEKDFTKIQVRKEIYRAIVEGYLEQMNDELSDVEKKYFMYAGKFLIYMQALRFLTDYFNNDIYYGALYDDHNLVRAGNQLDLLNKLCDFERSLH